MYFNLPRYICQFVFFTAVTLLRTGGGLAAFPVRLAFRIMAWSVGGLAMVTITPASAAIRDTFFKPPEPKRYMKIGKPAAGPLLVNYTSRPSMQANAGQNFTTRDAREDFIKRSVAQKQRFVAQFTDVVQLGA